ncbi:MAG: heme o synthase, partial [Terriglobia bacterium]
ADQKGRFMTTQVIGFSLLLIPVSIMPVLMGHAGRVYLVAAVALGLAFLYFGARLAFSRSNVLARRLVLASVVYLPLIYLLMIVNKASA